MRITISTPSGQSLDIDVQSGITLAQAVYTSGLVMSPALCNGLGRCGKCRLRFKEPEKAPPASAVEEKLFSSEELAHGWRLSCRHQPVDGMALILPDAVPIFTEKASAAKAENLPILRTSSEKHIFSLALDLGTTSIEWEMYNQYGKVVEHGKEINPQMGAGSEVISRLAYAARPEQATRLSKLIRERILFISKQSGESIREMCIAGNPAMLYLLLALPVQGLALAPYHLDYRGGSLMEIDPSLPRAYIPPLCSPFIGADLTAGMAYLAFGVRPKPEYPYLLADLGTNGEFILALSEKDFFAASVPMGPALEGIGLVFGTVAVNGAIADFEISPSGLAPICLDRLPAAESPGITGSGYLALVHKLKRLGLVDPCGLFNLNAKMPLAAKIKSNFNRVGEEIRFNLPGSMYLTAMDVEQVLKVKAAFNLAVAALLDAVGLTSSALKKVYLAGAMGLHVNKADLLGLGFLPDGMDIKAVGNTSLMGAGLLLHSGKARSWVETVTPRISVVDLSADISFGEKYIKRMVFEYV